MKALVLFAMVVWLGAGSARAGEGARGYGWLDVGAAWGGLGNRLAPGFAVSGGAGSFVQVGGRFRFASFALPACGPLAEGDAICGDGRAQLFSLGPEIRKPIPLTSRLSLAVGAGIAAWVWYASQDFRDAGLEIGGDVRVSYRLGDRLGIHLASELREGSHFVWGSWTGLNW